MSKMTEPRELFLHELGDILYAERVLVNALPRLEEEATDSELAKGFKAPLAVGPKQVGSVDRGLVAEG